MSRTTIALLLIPLLVASAAAAPGKGHDNQRHDTDWSLTLVVDGLEGIDPEFLRVIAEHTQAGIPVSVAPGPNLAPEAMAGLQEIIDPRIIRPVDGGHSIQGQDPTSDEDCKALILTIMDEPPFLDPIVRPECLTEPQNCPSLLTTSLAICKPW